MAEAEASITEVFSSLSKKGKELLLSLVHSSSLVGMKRDAILFTPQVSRDELEAGLRELMGKKLVIQGYTSTRGREQKFLEDPTGDRFALPLEVKRSVLKDILKLPEDSGPSAKYQ